ncbi:MAG: hypothetical protein JOZ12_15680, partial [Sinobacteraceae bacterium]|nr:hypothetical protein [Nevskiaceae bacterium]
MALVGMGMQSAAQAAEGESASPPDKADVLIRAAKQATGGEAWDRLVSWHELGKLTSGGLKGHYDSWIDLTSLHNSSSFELGPISGGSGWDGKQAWTTDSSKEVRVETSAEASAQAIQDAYRSGWGLFFPSRFPARREYVGARRVDGTDYEVVK